MRPPAVVVLEVLAKDQPEVALVEDEQPIQSFMAKCLDDTLAMALARGRR